MTEKKGDILPVMVFLLIIFGLSIGNLAYPERTFSEKENRYLAVKPEFTWRSLYSGSFSGDFEKYTTDQFIYRDTWTEVKALCEIARLKRDNNGVYIGSDGYLLGKYQESDINKVRLEENINYLVGFVDKISKQLGQNKVSVVIVPMSSSILKDKLPPFAYGFDQDAMIDSIKTRTSRSFVDIRQALRENSHQYIYYKTDHHWTSLGAYIAYDKWCRSIGEEPVPLSSLDIREVTSEFYGTYYSKANLYTISPDSISIFVPKNEAAYRVIYNAGEREEDTLYNLSYLTKRDKYSLFLNGNNPLVKIETHVGNGRNLLIVKDSFAHTFAPLAALSFETVHMIDLRHYNMSLSQYISDNNITDVLVLYSTMNLSTDANLHKLNK